MKKTKLLLIAITAAFSFSVIGCSPNNSPIIYDTNTIEGLIGFTAKKYVEDFDNLAFANKCKLDNKTTCYHDELLNAIRLAFDGNMPEHTGERTYLGYFGNVDKARNLNEEENKNFEFLNNIGLIGEQYDPDKEVDMDDTQLYINRLYKYFGNNYKDDFARAKNYDFYFSGEEDADWTYDKDDSDSLILNKKRVQQNVDNLYFDMKNSGFEPSVANLDKYIYGDETYDIKEDEFYISQLEAIQECENNEELLALEVEFQETNTINCFGLQFNSIYSLSKNSNSGFSYVISRLNLGKNTYISNLTEYENNLQNVIEDYTNLLKKYSFLSDAEIDEYIASYEQIVTILREDVIDYYPQYFDCNDDTFFNDLIVSSDSTFGEGVFEKFFGDLVNCPYAIIPITEVIVTLLFMYEVYYEGISFKDFKNFCYLSYIAGIKSFLNEFQDGKLSKRLFQYITEYTMMSYYQGSTKYNESITYCLDMIDDLKESYAEIINGNEYISSISKEHLIEKINAIGSTIMFESNLFDYKISEHFDYEYTGSVIKDYFYIKNFICSLIKELATDGNYRAELTLFKDEVFVSNAYYSVTENQIYIPTGAVMCVGYDYSEVDDEEIFGIIGEVIAHELSHSIDPTGIYYDKGGKYVNYSILSPDDVDLYVDAQKAIKQYYSVEVATDVEQVANYVLSEAVADNLGLEVLTNLLEKKQDFDFETFFEVFANHFALKYTRAFYLSKISAKEEHPLGPERLNLLLKNCLKFQQTYNLSNTDGMYMAEEDIIKIL